MNVDQIIEKSRILSVPTKLVYYVSKKDHDCYTIDKTVATRRGLDENQNVKYDIDGFFDYLKNNNQEFVCWMFPSQKRNYKFKLLQYTLQKTFEDSFVPINYLKINVSEFVEGTLNEYKDNNRVIELFMTEELIHDLSSYYDMFCDYKKLSRINQLDLIIKEFVETLP